MKNALLVAAHPRRDSLTAQITEQTRDRLVASGHTVDLLDLHAEGFDPRMTLEDEPDWTDRDKVYSAEVREHMRRIDAADVIVVVFPVWWYGLPAILKGWIDRVWNYGFAYGRSKARLAEKRMLWLGLAGESEESYAEHGLNDLLARQLQVGISNYCGIKDVSVRFVYGTIPDGSTPTNPLTTADITFAEFI
ncbi:NAD(P)H oxidoreductase [Actinomadura rudentiformis]|uniref:NAD(P)H oxidoreductase n=1 Tax=Actinomadura rudentiformis TaxID=359158 RepID=A0A6H9YWZ0_9ACTN|nr:NAD(P)H oxidoreductase [Actinomadura rudentiformis]KAB2348511.1 NAD(P)H oxidoreductase [Actinomadura rudentiformis]